MESNVLESLNAGELPPLSKDSLAKASVGALIPSTLEEALILARTLYMSRLFPDLQNAQQAFVKILAGAEMGYPPLASLNSFHIIKGKIMAHYALIGGRIRAAGFDYRVTDHSDERCAITFYNRSGDEIGDFYFTKDDAKKAGTQNMDKMPRTMLFARALAQGARFFVPEAFNGLVVYANEEKDSFDAEEQFPEDHGDAPLGTSDRLAATVVSSNVPEDYDPFVDEDEPKPDPVESLL